MKNKIVWFIITMAFVVILPFNLNVKAAQELCESDQVISGYNPLSQTSIIAYSPFRVGDTGTGSDYLATITSQYNQPRYESGIKRVHIGVDLQALNSNNLGRNVFSVYGAGKVVATGTSPSYGEYVTIEHKHTSGGKEYYFQSFYAHLASRTLTSTTPTYTTPYTQQVGVEGRTGATTAIHLHLEFRTPGGGTLRYAPALFYWQKGSWGTNTSFINFTGKSGNKVTFNIVSYDNGNAYDVPSNKVKIYYKKDGVAGSFTPASMIKSGNTFTYTFSGYPVGTKLRFYVEAQENRWDGNYYYAYRPYYNRLSVKPPEEKCFLHTMTSTTASISPDDLSISSGKTIEQIAQEVIEAGGIMEPMINIPWEPTEEGVKKGLELNDVSFMAKVFEINEDGSMVVESVTGAEMLKKNDYDTYEIIKTGKSGVRYTVNLTFDFTPEIGKVYRLKGQYDSKTNNITVYHFLFFNEYYED